MQHENNMVYIDSAYKFFIKHVYKSKNIGRHACNRNAAMWGRWFDDNHMTGDRLPLNYWILCLQC